MSIKNKLIAVGVAFGLIVAAYNLGKFVESNACVAKATAKQVTSELKGRDNADKIAKDVDRLNRVELDAAYDHWLRK